MIGQRIGALWTLVWLLGAAMAGVTVMRTAGAEFLPRLVQATTRGEDPFAMLLASGRRFLAGVLLILPGLGSDLVALVLLLWPTPPVRAARPAAGPGAARGADDDVIEGEFRRED